MTKAQKAEYLREKEARERAEMRRQGKEIPPELQQSQSKSRVPNKGTAASSATPRQPGTNLNPKFLRMSRGPTPGVALI